MKIPPIHVVVLAVSIRSRVSVSSVLTGVQKSIISKPKPCADMSPKVARLDLVANPELVPGINEN
jgi:hypothetical protein